MRSSATEQSPNNEKPANETSSLKLCRRSLAFNDLNEVLAEAQELIDHGYERAGKWSLGQCCNHVAIAMEMSLEGFPLAMPFPISTVSRWIFFHTSWGAKLLGGIRVPTFPQLAQKEPVADKVGFGRLAGAVERVTSPDAEFCLNPAMGRLTQEQWIRFHAFHAERHFGFLLARSER